jgi:hypothetical protein
MSDRSIPLSDALSAFLCESLGVSGLRVSPVCRAVTWGYVSGLALGRGPMVAVGV